MAKIILTFGRDRYLLPSERGVATLLSTLAAAQPLTLRDYREEDRGRYTIDDDRCIRVSVAPMPKNAVITHSRKAHPESASPDCHGTNITEVDQ